MLALAVAPTIEAASIGIPDTMLLMLLALVVFGPRRLPEIGRQLGKLMYEFRKVSNDFKFQMEEELRASEEADRQKKLAEAQAQAALTAPTPTPTSLSTPVAEPLTALSVSPEPAAAESTPRDDGEIVPAVDGEVRGEARSFPAGYVEGQIRVQPPTTGESVAAQKPFRGRVEEVATESGDAASRELETPVVVADEGRIGTEVQPGVEADMNTRTVPEAVPELGVETSPDVRAEDGREVHHA